MQRFIASDIIAGSPKGEFNECGRLAFLVIFIVWKSSQRDLDRQRAPALPREQRGASVGIRVETIDGLMSPQFVVSHLKSRRCPYRRLIQFPRAPSMKHIAAHR
jgi:hypothetical protein